MPVASAPGLRALEQLAVGLCTTAAAQARATGAA